MQINDEIRYEVRDRIAVITVDNPPVNAANGGVTEGLHLAMLKANADPQIQGIILIGAGRTFVAGADIKGFAGKRRKLSAVEAEKQYDLSDKMIVAAVHGTPYGGGMELAMRAHYRIASPGTRFALPEVRLGILAAGGGTQKLPRLIGVEPALDMMLSGDPMTLKDAVRHGLVDQIAEGDLLSDALVFTRRLIDTKAPRRRLHDRDEKLKPYRDNPEFFAIYRRKVAAQIDGFHAPAAIIRCVEACVNLSYDEGRKFEVGEFLKLREGPQRPALIHLFFGERKVRKLPVKPDPVRLGQRIVTARDRLAGDDPAAREERGRLAMINEAARLLDEGLAPIPDCIDLACTAGYGWPPYEGGPTFHADRLGIPVVVDRLDTLVRQDDDERWKPSPLLRRMAEEGRSFTR